MREEVQHHVAIHFRELGVGIASSYFTMTLKA